MILLTPSIFFNKYGYSSRTSTTFLLLLKRKSKISSKFLNVILYSILKRCNKNICLNHREMNYLYYSEIKYINFRNDKLIIVLENLKGD